MFNRSTSFSFGQTAAAPAAGTAGAAPASSNLAGSLFGTAASQPQQQQQQQATAPAATGFSFGQPQPQQQQQPSTGTSLFGGATLVNNNNNSAAGGAGGGGLFGASTGGLFGAGAGAAQPAAGTGGGAFSFGQPQQQQQQQLQLQPQQQQANQVPAGGWPGGTSPFFRYAFHQRERFNDLPEAPKKLLEELDEFIQSQHRVRNEIRTKDYGTEQIKKSSATVASLRHDLTASLTQVLPSDLSHARELGASLDADHRDLKHMCDIVSLIHSAGNPAQVQQGQQGAAGGRLIGSKEISEMGLGGFGIKYFAQVAEGFKERIERYREKMEAIERFLASLDGPGFQNPEAIADTLKHQHAAFMDVASRVTSLHAEVEVLRTDFTKWYQQTNNCIRDPFAGIVAAGGPAL